MGDQRNRRGGSPRRPVTALDDSLRRLGVDHVDLHRIHRWDPRTGDEAGPTMIQPALGSVTAHPAVTSALIGPARWTTRIRSSPPQTPCFPPTCSTRSSPGPRPEFSPVRRLPGLPPGRLLRDLFPAGLRGSRDGYG